MLVEVPMNDDSITFLRRTRIATWLAVASLGSLASRSPPFARAIVFPIIATIGVAHGATDDAMLARVGIRPRGGRATISLAYGTVAVATFALARRFPQVATRAFAIVSHLHFGSGDAAFARACGSTIDMRVGSFVRGALPLWIAGTDARSRAVAALATVVAARHAIRGRSADALDLVLPSALLLAIPPRLGFAIYFAAWHSVRHTALILARDPRGGGASERAGRFAFESAPNVAIAVGVAALAFAWERTNARGTADTEAIAGALILAITVPHELAVRALEQRARTR